MNGQKRFVNTAIAIIVVGIVVILLSGIAVAIDATGAKGIDVASTQHPGNKPIDWQKVYDSDIRFAWAKASEGKGDYIIKYAKKFFKEDMDKGTAAGLKMGAYHFARPVMYGPEEEAKHFVDKAKDYLKDGYLRPAVDIEVYEPTGENPCREKVVGASSLTNWIHAFMDAVKKQTDVEPLIYTGHFARESCFDSSITQYNLWFSQYSSPVNTGIWEKYGKDWDFWQYSSSGNVDGIGDGKTTPVDLDVFSGPESDLDKYVIHKPSIVGLSIPSVVEQGNEAVFGYSIKDPYSYAFDHTMLAVQIRKSNSKDTWIDLNDNEVISIIPGTYQYTKKLIIPTSVKQGNYDVKLLILNSENGNMIDSMLAESVLKVESASSTTPTSTITIVSPNSGEAWKAGNSYEIKWATTGNIGNYVDIELLKNGQVVEGVGVNALTSAGSVTLSTPNTLTLGNDYQIRITNLDNPGIADTSDGYFAVGAITVASPNGGENWVIGSNPFSFYPIDWTYIGNVGSTVKIELLNSCACGTPYLVTDSTSIGSNGKGSYSWYIPPEITSGSYIIRITSNEKPEFSDTQYL